MTDTYTVSYRGYKHISVEADSKEEAEEKAAEERDMVSWTVEDTAVHGPY